MGRTFHTVEALSSWREIAWNGIALPVPADWDLSGYQSGRKVDRIVLEDPTAVRAQIEWMATDGTDESVVRQAHAKLLGKSYGSAMTHEPIEDFPRGWLATRRRMEDGRLFMTALSVHPGSPFHVLLKFYGGASDEEPENVSMLRAMVLGLRFFCLPEAIPWRVFDLSVRVPARFTLAETSFLAGRKMMLFSHRLRRLWIWRLSLINRLLRDNSPAGVLAELLNRQKPLAGVRFGENSGGSLGFRRRAMHPFGHAEEIGRWCFRYRVRYRLDSGRNAMLAYVYQYRRESDLAWLEGLNLLDDTRVTHRPR